MKKRVISLLLIVVLTISLCAPAYATARATQISPSLSFSGTTANCSVVISAIGESINATLQLWRGSNLIASWPVSGTSYAANGGTAPAVSGETYILKVVGTIGGSTIYTSPVEGTCP